MSDPLSIASVVIENVKKIRYAELRFGRRDPGKGELIELFAGNDQGKTSLHDGLKSIFEPGKHPSLIRNGCEQARCVMELSDGVKIVRTHKPGESTYDVIGANGVDIPAPATYIKGLSKSFTFDPLAFDEADPKKQLEYLLTIAPITFSPDEVSLTLGPAAALLNVPTEDLDIATFGKFFKTVEDTRAATGARRKEKAGTIESLRKTMLASDSGDTKTDWTAELSRLSRMRDELDKFLLEDIEDIQAQSKPSREAVNSDIQRRENEAREVLRKTLSELATERQNRIGEIDTAERNAIDEVKAKGAKEREKVAASIATAQVSSAAQAASAANRNLMTKTQGECTKISAEYDALVAAAKDLDELRKSKLAASFVRGLEVREDGRIYVDGVYWRELNQAKRFLKAVEVVAQGTGDLGFITCDKGESLDVKSRTVFKRAVEQSGLQVVLFSVSTPEQIDKHGPELWSLPQSAVPQVAVQ